MKENNLFESELPCDEILEKMKNSTFDNFKNNSTSSTNKDYINQRMSTFKVIQKVTMRMGFKSQTFFLSVYYLDILFMKKKKININLNKVGLACLCLAAKYCENDPIVPQLQYFIKVYNIIMGYKKIISMSELMCTEVLVCKMLNYKLNYYSIYDFNSFFFCHGVLKLEQIKEIENDIKNNYTEENKDISINTGFIKNILGKIYKKSRDYLDKILKIHKICFKYNPLFIAILLVKKSVEEILLEEHINNLNHSGRKEYENDQKEKEEFRKKNYMYFKEIMNNFYKVDYESNEQYQKLILDDDVLGIFNEKRKNNKNNVNEDNYLKEGNKDDKNDENKININEDIKNDVGLKKNFNNSVTNGFYKRLKLSSNEKINYNKNERNTFSLINNNNEKENIQEDIDINLNINNLRNSQEVVKKDKKLNKKIMPRINTYNNFENHIIKENKNNKINEEKAKSNNNLNFNKMKSSNILNYKKINNNPKKIKFNSLNEKIDYSFNIQGNNFIKNSANNNFKRKPYFKKLIKLNNKDLFNSVADSFRASTGTHFYSTKINNTLHSNNIQFNSSEIKTKGILKTESNINNSVNSSSYVGSFYNKNKNSNHIKNGKSLNIIIGETFKKKTKKKFINNNINISTATKTENKPIIKDNNDSNNTNTNTYNSNNNSDDKIIENKKSSTNDNFYPKINMNTTKESEMKNININTEMNTKKLSNVSGKKNNILNKNLKEINKAISKNITDEKKKKCQTSRFLNNTCEDKQNNVNILNKNIKDNKIIQEPYKVKKQNATNLSKNKIIKEKNKKIEKTKIIFNSNIPKQKYSFGNNINHNNINNGAITTRGKKPINKNKDKDKEKNKDNNKIEEDTQSSIFKIIQKTKNFFTKKISNKDINTDNKKLPNKNFYKSQQNFYKKKENNKSTNKYNNTNGANFINEDDNMTIINEISEIKNDINKKIFKKEKSNYSGKKNLSTIIINNNININIGNKPKNLKISKLSLNNNTKNNYNSCGKYNSQVINNKSGNINININNSSFTTRKTLNSLFNKLTFNKKYIDKDKK